MKLLNLISFECNSKKFPNKFLKSFYRLSIRTVLPWKYNVGNSLRNGSSLSHCMFHLRPGIFQFRNYFSLPIFGSSVQISSSQVFGIGNLHRKAASKSRCHSVHPLRRPQYRYRNTLLGLHFRHYPRQCYFHRFGKYDSLINFFFSSHNDIVINFHSRHTQILY